MFGETKRKSFLKLFFLLVLLFAFTRAAMAARFEENNCVPDLNKSLSYLSSTEPYGFTIQVENDIPSGFYRDNLNTLFGKDDHFQGILRLRDPNYLIISGAVLRSKTAQLLIADLSEKNKNPEEAATPNNQLLSRIDFADHTYWHAGGLARLGDIVVVPLEHREDGGNSRIVFFDFSTPQNPKLIPTEIDRSGKNAGAVALEKLGNGRFVVAVYTEGSLDFYYSKTAILEDGFMNAPVATIPASESGSVIGGEGLNLIRQCDGKIFYANFNNAGFLPPLFNGPDRIRLFEVSGMQGTDQDAISLFAEATYHFYCHGICNFAASGSVFVGEDHKVRVYSTGFYRTHSGSSIPFAEFYEP